MPGGRGSPQGCGGRSRQAGVVGPTSKDGTDSKRLWNLQGIWVGPLSDPPFGPLAQEGLPAVSESGLFPPTPEWRNW